ncbi:hypothetical protein RRG08_012657 [Elysia crispata]|uniref:Uncharacterized protein n=1 Tax=Elysia crispata TaxID=231223 RepID=A0AAE0YNJ2_9GAST|nr:hypothetical protein RRG08_012657 [Elysia crispata]
MLSFPYDSWTSKESNFLRRSQSGRTPAWWAVVLVKRFIVLSQMDKMLSRVDVMKSLSPGSYRRDLLRSQTHYEPLHSSITTSKVALHCERIMYRSSVPHY